jgi:hypothetical protein
MRKITRKGGLLMRGIDLEEAQELLDSGLSRTKVAKMLNVHHSCITRLVDRGKLFVYEAFDEEEDKRHLYQNFEWLWEEDLLEDVCNAAFDDYHANLNEILKENFWSVGNYVNEKYGCIENYLKVKGNYFLAEFIYMECSTCGDEKHISNFSKRKNSKFPFGLDRQCKTCVVKRVKRNWRENDDYRQSVRDKHKIYIKENKEKMQMLRHRRLARLKQLPNDITDEQLNIICEKFNGCALTGETTNVHMDHVIPLSIGHGGSIYGNMIPLRADLNISKNNRNIFEWFEENKERFNLSQEKFDELIEYLAEINKMTVEEYRDYVYWCHDNPREVDDDYDNRDEKEATA